MPDPTTDFGIFDRQELVSWITGSGSVDNIRAVRRPLLHTQGRRIEQFVSLEATDVVYHIEAAPLVEAGIALGDSLQAGTRLYLVLFYEYQSFGTTILVVCRPS